MPTRYEVYLLYRELDLGKYCAKNHSKTATSIGKRKMGGRALDNPELDTSPTKKILLADTTVAERGGAEKDDFRPLLLLLVAPMALRGLKMGREGGGDISV